MELNEQIRLEQKSWADPAVVAYYEAHRHRSDELYNSERFFLPEVLTQVESVLDLGCAAGGFFPIMRSFNPKVRYVGIDITPSLVDLAREKYPAAEFHLSDGIQIPFANESFDLVHASGVLHLNSQYREILKAMWKVTRKYVLVDSRLSLTTREIGEQRLSKTVETSLPYHVVNLGEWISLVHTLKPRPKIIRIKGYSHTAAETVNLQMNKPIMAFNLIEKGPTKGQRIEIDLNDC